MARTLKIGQYSGTKIKEARQPNFTCSVTTYDSVTFDRTRHYHPKTHLSFVLAGGCEEQKKDRYNRTPLSTTFYYPGEEHQINHIANQSVHVNIEFNDSFFNYPINESLIESACKSNLSLPFLMIKIYNELLIQDDLSNVGIETSVLSLFDTHQQTLNIKQIPLWAIIAKDYIWDNWNTNLCLDRLAIVCGVHKVTISKYFAKYHGSTPSDYQRQIRLIRAVDMIRSNQYSLTEITFLCGFADQSHFIRSFKLFMGFLPKQFQRLQR